MGAVLDLCASVSTVPIRRSRPADLLAWMRSHISRKPFLVERDDLDAMQELVLKVVNTREIEAIHADQLTMAQFALEAHGVSRVNGVNSQLVFDAHNAVWMIVERMKQQSSPLLVPILDLEARRIKRYEGQVVRRFDSTMAVSEIDRDALVEASASKGNGTGVDPDIRRRITVVPIGIDTKQNRPVQRSKESTNILSVGSLHYPPNADGVRWFANEVFPLIRAVVPDANLTIVGKNPPRDIRGLKRRGSAAIEVAGYAQDLTPYLKAAAVMVVPVRAGGGMRVRILEGFARGMPMVTTTLGLEGIDAEPGRDILVADSAEEFANAVSRLLRDRGLRADLSGNGRKLVVEKYDWRIALKPLAEIYADAQMEAYAV